MGLARLLAVLLPALVLPAGAAGQTLQPRAAITSGPPELTEATSATFTFESRGGLTSVSTGFECRLDEGPWRSCSSPASYSDLGGGPHSFAVRLTGALADPTPDRRVWTVAARTVESPCGAAGCVDPIPQQPIPPRPRKPPRPPKPRPRPPNTTVDGCKDAKAVIGTVALARSEASLRCLVSAARRKADLRALRANRALITAAGRHAGDMVRRRYFAHVVRGFSGGDRAQRAGYMTSRDYWTVGEVLAWSERPPPTPLVAVRGYLGSPTHRAVLLKASYRDIGVGIRRGSPVRAGRRNAATFVVMVGRRSRSAF